MSTGEFVFGGASEETVAAAQAAQAGPGRFPPLPEGNYNFYVSDSEAKLFGPTSKNPGKPYLSLTIQPDGGKYHKRRIFNVMVPLFEKWGPTPKNPDGFPTAFLPAFTAFGYDVAKGFKADSLDDLANELIGKKFQARVRHEDDTYAYEKARDARKKLDETGEETPKVIALQDGETQADFQRESVGGWKKPGTLKISEPAAEGKKSADVIDLSQL